MDSMPRSFAIGDIHGDLAALRTVISRLPPLTAADTLVFLGDYVDRGPHSAQVVDYLMQLPEQTDARIVALRGNHEDAWLRVLDEGWDNFIAAPHTGTLAALRSYTGGAYPETIDEPTSAELDAMSNATFYPERVVEWFRSLPFWYEDENAIYLHGCVPSRKDGTFPHPRDVEPQGTLAWCSDPLFFKSYAGKRIVVGHTRTKALPQDLSEYTPDDPTDLFRHGNVFGLDTGCGAGGFLTGLELPALRVYESRAPQER
jgi:serine/threonine protein phosphatase 1